MQPGASKDQLEVADGQEFRADALDLLRRVGKDNLVRGMTERFEANAPARVSAMRASCAAGDAAGVASAAHSLKSSAGQLGAVGLQMLCGEIEDAADRRDDARVAELVARAEPMLDRALTWLRSLAGETEGHTWQKSR